MDIGTILIGVIFVAVCAAFFIGINLSQKARRRNIMAHALQIIGVTLEGVGDYSISGNVIIGWLNGEKEFFFYRNSSTGIRSWRISLQDIRQIQLVKEVKSRSTANGNYSFANSIQLRLISALQGKPDVFLPLFSQEEDAQVGSELEVGQDWEKKIRSRLNA
ncbi:MAG: hypothetical protein K9I85_07160 [Saprospiraceae bacterium]|nr:hypothetical protein [Saprospiraceae bacterium]